LRRVADVADLREYGLVPASEMREELAGAAKGIPLYTKGGVIGAFAVVDAADYEWASQHRWRLHTTGRAVRGQYDPATQGTVTVRLHRELMGLALGDPREVDHINRDPLDNRRANLRVVSHQQNRQNTNGQRGSTSRYLGVSWDASRGQWKAQAKLHGRGYFIGRYETEQEAADAAAAWRERHMPFNIEPEEIT
jgi:hypothetical protein